MNRDYSAIDEAIKTAYVDLIKNEKRMPTQSKIAEVVGVSRETVNKHLNNIDLTKLVQPYRIFGNEVLMGLMKKASSGDTQAAKLFFMLIYDWNEKSETKVEHTGAVTIKNVAVSDKIAKKVLDEVAKEGLTEGN